MCIRDRYVAELEANDADAIENARVFVRDVMEDESNDMVEVRDYLRMRNFLHNHENEFEFSSTTFQALAQERDRRVSLRVAKVVA